VKDLSLRRAPIVTQPRKDPTAKWYRTQQQQQQPANYYRHSSRGQERERNWKEKNRLTVVGLRQTCRVSHFKFAYYRTVIQFRESHSELYTCKWPRTHSAQVKQDEVTLHQLGKQQDGIADVGRSVLHDLSRYNNARVTLVAMLLIHWISDFLIEDENKTMSSPQHWRLFGGTNKRCNRISSVVISFGSFFVLFVSLIKFSSPIASVVR
jgi:hypothetical protein